MKTTSAEIKARKAAREGTKPLTATVGEAIKSKGSSKQLTIESTKRKRNTRLSECAERYRDLRDKSIVAGNKASEAKSALILMIQGNLEALTEVDGDRVYVDEECGFKLTYSDKANVKIRTLGNEGEDE